MFFWHIDCNLYNHSLTTHTMFKLCFVYSKAMVNLCFFFYDKTMLSSSGVDANIVIITVILIVFFLLFLFCERTFRTT